MVGSESEGRVSITLDTRPFTDVPNRFTFPEDRAALVTLFWKARRILEIGINDGRTAKLLLDNLPRIESYIGIDVPPWHKTRLEVQRTEVPQEAGFWVLNDKRVRIFDRPGGSEAVTVEEIGECDAAFIDGDHSRIAVKHDTALARACVKKGIIAWHDYLPGVANEVAEVIDAMAAENSAINHVRGTWLAYERIR